MSTNTARLRSIAFFAAYIVLLVFGLFWVNFPYVRDRVGDGLATFYVLDAVAIAYVLLRAYLVLGKRIDDVRWRSVWLATDVIIITGVVGLTGGIRSEAAVMYFLPIATSSITRRPGTTLLVGLASGILYVVAVRPTGFNATEFAWLGTRLLTLLLITILAACYARTEIARVEEIARLRGEVALADYRSRLSQEMHDGIQHYLVTIAARLSLADKLVEGDPAQAAKMAVEQLHTVGQAADELRYLVRRLRSPVIERQGFVSALREHLDLFAERSSLAISVETEGDVRPLPPDSEQAAFRIVQEALTNAEKHAEATQVKVSLAFRHDAFECCITDNGVGFDASQERAEADTEEGLGLAGMRQRAESLGARLSLESAPGQGTKITFSVPLRNSDSIAPEGVGDVEDQGAGG